MKLKEDKFRKTNTPHVIMKSLSQLMQEIILLTTEIETKYPELYKYLDETPLSICETKEKTICTDDMKEYLETLKGQLLHHIETHEKKSIE